MQTNTHMRSGSKQDDAGHACNSITTANPCAIYECLHALREKGLWRTVYLSLICVMIVSKRAHVCVCSNTYSQTYTQRICRECCRRSLGPEVFYSLHELAGVVARAFFVHCIFCVGFFQTLLLLRMCSSYSFYE